MEERDRNATLEDLQRAIRVIEAGGPGPALDAAAVRRRIAARSSSSSIRDTRLHRREEERRRFEASLRGFVERARERDRRRGRRPVTRTMVRHGDAVDGHPRLWTPSAILGFRAWRVTAEGLAGVRARWERPELSARCDGGVDPTVPHTDESCGHPPCGIYALPDPDALMNMIGFPWGRNRLAYGLVAMSGKVVEHEFGYRSARARVVAVAVAGRGTVTFVDGGILEPLFRDIEATLEEVRLLEPERVVEYASDGGMRSIVSPWLWGKLEQLGATESD